jgi:hypothetical protein
MRFSVDQMNPSYSMTTVSVQVRMALKRFPKHVLFVGLDSLAIVELTCAGLRLSLVSLL